LLVRAGGQNGRKFSDEFLQFFFENPPEKKENYPGTKVMLT
jgi:hypothetical protein